MDVMNSFQIPYFQMIKMVNRRCTSPHKWAFLDSPKVLGYCLPKLFQTLSQPDFATFQLCGPTQAPIYT